jgi:hypothetical protein
MALAKVRGTIFANYRINDFSISVRERWRSKLDQANVPNAVYVDGRIPRSYYTDLTISYAVPNKFWGTDAEVSLNIQNLLDADPKNVGLNTQTGIGNAAGFVNGDDPVGRYFTLGLKLRH